MRRVFMIAVLCLSGCTMRKGFTPEQLAELESSRPRCTGDVQCRVMWTRARQWLIANTAYKIQTATEDLLETYNGGRSATGLAIRVTKNAEPDGSYTFDALVGCNNFIACDRDLFEVRRSFNTALVGD